MTEEKMVPQWVEAFIQVWKKRLFLGEWSVSTVLSDSPDADGSGCTKAVVQLHPDIRHAEITLHAEIGEKPTGEWQHNILHELVHMRLAGVSEPVLRDLLWQLAPQAREIADRWFRHEVEEVVDLLAYAFLKLAREEHEE